MKYKFLIYKQKNLAATFNKYDLAQYSFVREITQNSKWGLNIQRDREFFTVIRREFEGDITVKGADFDALIALEETYIQYAVVIERECEGVYTEFWKGFFSYFDFTVDRDRCYMTFTPAVWDAYAPIFNQMPIERNILAAGDPRSVLMDNYEYDFEEVTRTISYSGPVPAPAWVEYSLLPAGNKYYFYSRVATFQGWDETYEPPEPIYTQVDTYRRDWRLLADGVNPGGNWVLDPQLDGPGEYSPGVFKWVRPYLDSVYTTPYVQQVNGYDVSYTLQTSAGVNISFAGCRTLKDVLEYFASFFNLTYVSDFFNDDPCPMGLDTLELTMLLQVSNIRDTAETARKGNMKLKDLLTQIRDTFNVYWYIDSNGDFRLEHLRYFESGLTYGFVLNIALDLTGTEFNRKLNRYEWATPKLFRFEQLEFPYSLLPDWIEAGIEYPQYSILGNETLTKSSAWGTDIVSMYDDRENLGRAGFALLNCNFEGGGVLLLKVVNTAGAFTGSVIQNGRFSQANLLRDLWTWGRLLPTGKVNGADTTFDSIERLRKQVELTFPMCCQDVDFNGLFRTELGDGLLDTAMYEANTGMVKINLLYE